MRDACQPALVARRLSAAGRLQMAGMTESMGAKTPTSPQKILGSWHLESGVFPVFFHCFSIVFWLGQILYCKLFCCLERASVLGVLSFKLWWP